MKRTLMEARRMTLAIENRMKSSSSLRSPLCRTSVLVDYYASVTKAAETGDKYLPLLELVLELIEIEGWTMTPL
jgi:hypothetical protein